MFKKLEMKMTEKKTVEMHKWELCINENFSRCLRGYPVGHCRIADNIRCRTSSIVDVEIHDDFVLFHTKHTIYKCEYADCNYFSDNLKKYDNLYEKVREAYNKKNRNKIMKYKALELDVKVPELLTDTIDEFLFEINERDGMLADCYEQEIRNLLNCYDECIPADTWKELRRYYVHGGIYNNV